MEFTDEEKFLIERWEKVGLLDGIQEDKKLSCVLKYEKACEYLIPKNREGELKEKLGSSKEIEDGGVRMDRDYNGARGIFLLATSSYATSG